MKATRRKVKMELEQVFFDEILEHQPFYLVTPVPSNREQMGLIRVTTELLLYLAGEPSE